MAPASAKSFRVAIARSGMPRRDAVVAAPLSCSVFVRICDVVHTEDPPLVKAGEAGLEGTTCADAVADTWRDL